MWKCLAQKWNELESASGLVSSGSGMGGTIDGGIGAVVLSSILGAFLGMICGLLLSHLARFLAMIFNRPLGGYSWVIIGTIAGAAVFTLLALYGDKD